MDIVRVQKLPVVFDALRYTGMDMSQEAADFCGHLFVGTSGVNLLVGDLCVPPGHWLVKGPEGITAYCPMLFTALFSVVEEKGT